MLTQVKNRFGNTFSDLFLIAYFLVSKKIYIKKKKTLRQQNPIGAQ